MSTYFTNGYGVATAVDNMIRLATGAEQLKLNVLSIDNTNWDYVTVKYYDNSDDATYTLLKNKAINVGSTFKFPIPINLEQDDILYISGTTGNLAAGFARIAKYDNPESLVIQAKGDIVTDSNWVIIDSGILNKTGLTCLSICNNGASTVNYSVEVYDYDSASFRPVCAVETEITASETHTIEAIPMRGLDYIRIALKSGQTGNLHVYAATQIYG